MPLPDQIYHLAEEANWSAIEEHGLLPAATLIANALASEPALLGLVRAQRVSHTVLATGVHIRDQKPMPPKALASCLVSLTPPEWYALINAHVFFWLDPERLNRQRRACGKRAQIVATVRTAELLKRFAPMIFLTPFNVGYALRKPARRSEATLVPYGVWSSSGWLTETQATGCKPRSRSHQPTELLVRGPIPHFEGLVTSVVKLAPGELFAPIGAQRIWLPRTGEAIHDLDRSRDEPGDRGQATACVPRKGIV